MQKRTVSFQELYQHIAPHYLFTNTIADPHWQDKASRAERLGISFVGTDDLRTISSTKIVERLQAEI